MILADTGYLLALVNPADQHHARAIAWSVSITEPLVVTEYVLVEAVNALSRRSLRRHAHTIIEVVRSEPHLNFMHATAALLEGGIRLHRQHRDKEWFLTDCVSFHVMRLRGIQRALAYDRHFEQAGFEAMLRHDPA